jgi:ABC-type multidrug transport system ATPase subunit
MQQVADTVSIIGRGRLLASGYVNEILAAADSQTVRVGIADPDLAKDVLEAAGYLVIVAGPFLTVGISDKNQRFDPAGVTQALAAQGLYVQELTPVRADLESVFLELTAEEHLGVTQHGPDAAPPSATERLGPLGPGAGAR